MKVLIVDDSIVFRSAIKTALLDSGHVKEIDVASNGKIACEKLLQRSFDGVTLDLEMPVMDGIETIKEIRKFNKDIPIIIFSAQNLNAANKTIKALEIGANDFVQKLQNNTDVNENLKMIQNELVPTFEALLAKKESKHIERTIVRTESSERSMTTGDIHPRASLPFQKANLVCIGSSTGGPDFLMRIFKKVGKLDVPVLLVQHMPPIFTTQLAKTLDELSPNKVVEAKEGDILENGVIYIAPGDYHMRLKKTDRGHRICLDQSEKVCFVRPAVDVTLNSVCDEYDGKVITYIFTGMGSDGADGCAGIRRKNGIIAIQDEESSVVWGMPRAVYDRGLQDLILDADEIVNSINQYGTK